MATVAVARYKPQCNTRLLDYLRRTGRSGSWLARQAGVKPSTLFRIEHGQRGAPGGWYARLAAILGCREEDIAPPEAAAA